VVIDIYGPKYQNTPIVGHFISPGRKLFVFTATQNVQQWTVQSTCRINF